MRIESLVIQNFRGFKEFKLEFAPHFNLLVGNNGSGKTSILDAVYIAAGSWLLGIDGPQRAPSIDEDEVRLVSFEYETGRFSFERQYPARIKANGVVMDRHIEWMREKVSNKSTTRYSAATEIRDIGQRTVASMRAGGPVILPLISAYGTERLWIEPDSPRSKQVLSKERPTRLNGYRNIQFLIHEKALFDWISTETLASLQVGKDSLQFSVVKKAIVRCIEDAEDLYYDIRRQEVVVVMKKHGTLPYNLLSDGQRAMLTLAGDIAKKAIELNPHLNEKVLLHTPGIVTIDELDIHLHPRWQRRVIKDLKKTFPAIQFIASTHSPQLIGEADPQEIIILPDFIGKTTKSPESPNQSFGMDSNWILKYVMDTDDRDGEIKFRLDQIETLILDLKFDAAQQAIQALRRDIGNHPDIVRLSTRIDRLAGNKQ